jgi:hypothetical protein
MALKPEQRSILDAIYRRASRVSDPGKRARYTRAAVETGLVESGLRNLPGGDADSQGWRQERASLYANPRNVGASVNRFFNELAQVDKGQPSYELAALVQRPASQYRGRYREVADQAAQILKGTGGSGGGTSPGGAGTPKTTITDTHLAFDPAQAQAAQALTLPERPQVQVTAPTAPDFAAKAVGPSGYQAPAAPSSTPPRERFDAGQALEALQTLSNTGGTKTVKATATVGGNATTGGGSGGGGGGGPRGRVILAPGANRAGAPLQSQVKQFVGRVAGRYGSPLTIGTGTNHSRLTVNGTVSDHWAGNGADVPLAGRSLVKAGQDALIAAGMSPAKARKQRGGGFNVGKWQVIFNTNAPGWGDHTDHLHVGYRG